MSRNCSPIEPRKFSASLAQLAFLLLVTAAFGLGASCQSPSRKPNHKVLPLASSAARGADAPAHAKIEALLKRDEKTERDETPETPSSGLAKDKKSWVIDELVDVGPAGPAAASREGVVLVSRDSGVVLAPLRQAKAAARPVATPIESIDADPKSFVARARGPAIVGDAAFWIEGANLVRQPLHGGAKETLASDARAYTQVAAPSESTLDAPAMVAYIAVSPADPQSMIARLWVQGQAVQTLSPEGTTANTVALAYRGTDWLALSLEGRTGMSPLHARPVSLGGNSPKLGPDFIAWIAGSAQPMTMLHAISDGTNTWALLPIERDISRFGLVRVRVSERQNPSQEIFWRNYPNGMDPAPVATGRICDKPVVLYARPSAATPHAPQELQLATLVDSGLAATTLIGSSRAFWDVSLANLESGALVVYVADHRTWARRIRCLR